MPKLPVDPESDRKGSMDVLCNSDEFRMYCFKVLPCSKHYSHDWTICPFAHPGEKARRRDPRVFKYAGVECPHVKEGLKCPRGDLCPFAHNIFECWLHPTRYRTQLCNEPASCKRKVCFFAHALDELREPSNPLDTLPEGGIGSGTAPRMSLDGLAAANALNGLIAGNQPHRMSFDVSSLGQVRSSLDVNTPTPTSPVSSQLNLNNLLTGIQALNMQGQVQQNQQLAQLVVGLLGEIAQNDCSQQQQQQQLSTMVPSTTTAKPHPGFVQPNLGYGNAVSTTTMAPPMGQSLPRWSVDGHLISQPNFSSQPPPIQPTYQFPHPGDGVLSGYNAADNPLLNRNQSMEGSIRDAVSQGLSSISRVSIDNSALSQTPLSPQGVHFHQLHRGAGVPLTSSTTTTTTFSGRNPQKQSFQSILEDPTRLSDDRSSSGTSSGDFSLADCHKTECFPVSYPLEGNSLSTDKSAVDSTLPEPFILF